MTDDTPTDPRGQFQHLLDWTMDDETLVLDAPKERPGPVVVRNHITVDGRGCTVWSQVGPVVHVMSDRAVLKDLRIEYTGPDDSDGPNARTALRVDRPGLSLENVTVRGAVVGLAAEAGEWRYPHQLNLGTVLHGVPHAVRVRMIVPVPCQLSSEVAGVSLQPRTLTPGAHEVRVLIDPLLRDTLVCGTITIKTAFLRREIILNALAPSPAPGLPPPASEPDRIAWQPADWDTVSGGAVIVPPAPPPRAVEPLPKPIVPPPAASTQVPRPAAVPPPPVSTPASQPASLPARPGLKTVTGALLGGAFASPPLRSPAVQPAPAPASPPIPDDASVASPPVKPKSVPVRPASALFGPTVPAAPHPPAEVPHLTEAVPPPDPPKPKKFKPASGLPLWAQPPKPPEPPPAK